jgi:hypothetical protein
VIILASLTGLGGMLALSEKLREQHGHKVKHQDEDN